MKEKNYQLEVLRVISCINVVLIHVCNLYSRSFGEIGQGEYVFSVILNAMARTSVPIFFMISGATSLGSHYDMKKYAKKVINMAAVVVVASVLYRIWNIVYFDRAYDYHDLFLTPTKLHLWYLYAYLGILIMLPFLQSMFRTLEKKYEILFVVIWFVFLVAYRVLDRLDMSIGYPLPIIGSTYYVGYFVIGHLINKYLKEIKIPTVWLYVIRYGSLITTVIMMCYGSFSRNKHYDWYWQYRALFIALQSIAMFLLIARRKPQKRKIFGRDLVTDIAKLSFIIYLIHPFFLDILKTVFPYQKMSAYYAIPLGVLCTFLCAFGAALIIAFIKGKLLELISRFRNRKGEA